MTKFLFDEWSRTLKLLFLSTDEVLCCFICSVQGKRTVNTHDKVSDEVLLFHPFSTGKEKQYDCALNISASGTTWRLFKN